MGDTSVIIISGLVALVTIVSIAALAAWMLRRYRARLPVKLDL